MKQISKIFALAIAVATPAMASNNNNDATESVDKAGLRVKFEQQVFTVQLPAFTADAGFKKKMIDAEGVEPSTYNDAAFLPYHKLACEFFKGMNDKSFVALANLLHAKTGEGKPLGHEARKAKVNKGFSKFLGSAAANVDLSGLAGGFANADLNLSWERAKAIYSNAVLNVEGSDKPIYVRVKEASTDSVRKMTSYLIPLSARYIAVTQSFVDEKLAAFDKANGLPPKETPAAEKPAPFNSEQYLKNYPHVVKEAEAAGVDPKVYAKKHYDTYKKHFPNLTDKDLSAK